MARARTRTRTRTLVRYRTRRAPNRRRHRRRNPEFGGMSFKDLLYMGGGALVNGIFTRAVPQMLLPNQNVGLMGYALDAIAGGAGAFALSYFNRRIGQGAWIGMIVALGQRIIADNFGSGTAAQTGGMSGDLDFDLGYYVSEGFPFPQGASAGPWQRFPGTPYAAASAFPATSASAVRAGNAAAAAALPAAAAPAAAANPSASRWASNWS